MDPVKLLAVLHVFVWTVFGEEIAEPCKPQDIKYVQMPAGVQYMQPMGFYPVPIAQGMKGDKGDKGTGCSTKCKLDDIVQIEPENYLAQSDAMYYRLAKSELESMKGEPGRPGVQGKPGPSGPSGEDGLRGLAGLPGLTGPAGHRGQNGEPGPRGYSGGQGPVGPAGKYIGVNITGIFRD